MDAAPGNEADASVADAAPDAGPRFSLKGLADPDSAAVAVVAQGFPAISADARQIAVAIEELRGMRDVPNATLRIHDVATWRVEREIELLKFSEGLDIDFSPAGRGARAALRARIAPRVEAANALFAGRGWKSLPRALPETEPPWQSKVQRARVDDLVISYASPTLTIAETGGRVLSSRATEWRLPSERALSPGYGPCTFEPYLHAAYFDRPSGVVLLLTGWSITHDNCQMKTLRWSLVRIGR